MRLAKIIGLASIVMLASSTSSASAETVYKCAKPDGSVEFSAKPCGDAAQPITVDGRSPYDKQRDAERKWHIVAKADPNTAKQCLEDVWRPMLKDPESGKLIDGQAILVTSTDRTLIVAEGRARNGFGGMNVQYFVCDMDHGRPANVHGDLRSIAEDIEKYSLDIALPGAGR